MIRLAGLSLVGLRRERSSTNYSGYFSKAGSTIISEVQCGLGEVYLAEVPKSVAGRHYVAQQGRPYAKLGKAMDTLGNAFRANAS